MITQNADREGDDCVNVHIHNPILFCNIVNHIHGLESIDNIIEFDGFKLTDFKN